MEITYPAGPAAVPADLLGPARGIRRRARIAFAALSAFFGLYLALVAWLAWSAARLLVAAGSLGESWGALALAGAAAAVLALFALKPLLFVRRSEASKGIEVTAEEQPRLFRFLIRLADEARAPRPRRVFLSARVTAAISWDVSIANLLLRPPLHLEVGLGLVNALSLGEFKAVVAHELGHFSRRMPTSARWVYVAWLAGAHVFSWRDGLDDWLHRLSRSDVRIAWLGRGLTLLASSLRSLVELVFRDVINAQRTLAREIEARADLIAVSLVGSDALTAALLRLRCADIAWDRVESFAEAEQRAGRPVRDLFAIQERVTEQLRVVLARPDFGLSPVVPRAERDRQRVFAADLTPAPRMWASHPANAQREQNVKRVYVEAPHDERSAWELFDDVPGLRVHVSGHATGAAANASVPVDESLRRVNEQFDRPHLNRAFRGAYLDRFAVRHAARPADLYDAAPEPPVARALASLYPESLGLELERARDLEEELAHLQAALSGHARTARGLIGHRGRELQPAELAFAIEQLREEIAAVSRSLHDHDRRCRAAHLAAAAGLKLGWEEYLRGLARVLHYADHGEANLRDAHGSLVDVVARVTCGGRMSEAELEELLQAAADVHEVLRSIHDDAREVFLDRTLSRRLRAASWQEFLGDYALAPPADETINPWLHAIDSAVARTAARLADLRLAALEQLLLSETQVARFVRQRMTPGAAPPPSRVPVVYPVLLPGQERPRRQGTRWWERLENSAAALPMTARIAVAVALVVAILAASATIGGANVTIYNALARPIRVSIGRDSADVAPLDKARLRTSGGDEVRVATRAADGRSIEEFPVELSPRGSYVYNVAAASPLVEWTALYGKTSGETQRDLGTPRWLESDADFLFEEPPAMLQTERGGAARTVLSGMAESRPEQLLSVVPTEKEQARLIDTHARWDDSSWKHTGLWLLLASERPRFHSVLAHRLAANPADALTLRMEQDATVTAQQRAHVCKRHTALAAASPGNADLQYIAARCLPTEPEKRRAFLEHHRAWPENGWLAMAAGNTLAEEGKWPQAQTLLEQARLQVPALSDYLAVDVARIRRIASADGDAPIEDLEKDSALVAFLHAAETGSGLEGSPLLAYRELARGRVAEAVEEAAGALEAQARVIRLAAASDGASASLVERALAMPITQGIDHDTIWPAIGLAARHKLPLDAYYEIAAKTVRQDAVAMRAFLEAVRAGTAPAATEAILDGVHMKLRAQAYGVAVIMLGRNAPPQWRERAKRLLFAYERPWFE